ncbi:MAG: DUF3450 domain-containing protein, partial [Gammaproteobacteria bacterium]|nr:DUF3450 domain-containing protein [Gammaproteobacteria bacterium]
MKASVIGPSLLSIIVIAVAILAAGNSAAQEGLKDAVSRQVRAQEASAAVQERINALDDQTREMLNEYRQTMSQVADLEAYNQQLERLVASQNVELADFER